MKWPNLKKREGKIFLNLSWWGPTLFTESQNHRGLLQRDRRAELSCELQEEDCVLTEFFNSPALSGSAGALFRDLPGLSMGTTLYFQYFCFHINYFDIAEKRK